MARRVFGTSWEAAVEYASILAGAGVEHGVLGPREVSRLWERHLVNCAVAIEAYGEGPRVCDVGSGAGLPGIVVALLRPELDVTLLEPLLRRCTFLQAVVRELALTNVRVVRGRAEEHEETYDIVTARAVAPLVRLAGLTLPLCRPGGTVVAFKGGRATEEVTAAIGVLQDHGASGWEIERYGTGVVEPASTVVRITAGTSRPVRRAKA